MSYIVFYKLKLRGTTESYISHSNYVILWYLMTQHNIIHLFITSFYVDTRTDILQSHIRALTILKYICNS